MSDTHSIASATENIQLTV